jgi:hypothetical protein
VHVVVNHLHLKEPLPPESLASTETVADELLAAGGLACHVVRVDELHLVLVLFFESAEDAERVARDVGGPWMREHVVPHLADGTQRSLGEAIVSRTR